MARPRASTASPPSATQTRTRATNRSPGGGGGAQRVDHSRDGAVERAWATGEDDPPAFLRLASHGEHLDPGGKRVEHHGRDSRDGEAGGDDLEFREPIADHIADL